MTGMTVAEQRAQREYAIKRLGEVLDRDSLLYTLTDYGRGETDYVRVFTAKAGKIVELTFYAARAAERRQTVRGIALGGGNYSKGLEVADDVHRAAFAAPLDQSKWREL